MDQNPESAFFIADYGLLIHYDYSYMVTLKHFFQYTKFSILTVTKYEKMGPVVT